MSSLLNAALDERRNYSPSRWCYVLGVMSGTSLDGLDLALTALSGSGPQLTLQALLKFSSNPIPANIRQIIQALLQQQQHEALPSSQQSLSESALQNSPSPQPPTQPPHPLELVCRLNSDWSRWVGQEIRVFLLDALSEGLLPPDQPVVIGSHGQTLWHHVQHHPFSTLQLGDGEILARSSGGRLVVSNFRATDIAVGGCGAPLVPYLDRVLHSMISRTPGAGTGEVLALALQNLGGIGNVTFINPAASTSSTLSLLALDTGPANVVLNEFIELAYHKYAKMEPFASQCWPLLPCNSSSSSPSGTLTPTQLCDWNGEFSSRGCVREEWLDVWWRAHATFFDAPPPKSTGRERFGAEFVQRYVLPLLDSSVGAELSTAASTFFDLCATAVEFTARSIADAYRRHLAGKPHVVALSGGGACNPSMLKAIREKLWLSNGISQDAVAPLSHFLAGTTLVQAGGGRDMAVFDEAKEAVAFAVLAHEKLNELAGAFLPFEGCGVGGTNVVSATGASCGVVLGQLSIPTSLYTAAR